MISEHTVQLDANFSKYGYSAHLRTKDSGEEGLSLESSTFDKEIWRAGRKLGETMRFYQKPIVRQYFHKGLLWRAREAQEVASYELFIDLFYVGISSSQARTSSTESSGPMHLLHSSSDHAFWESCTRVVPVWVSMRSSAKRYLVSYKPLRSTGFILRLTRSTCIRMRFEDMSFLVSFLLSRIVRMQLMLSIAMIWFSVHVPFIMSFVLSAGALAVLVRAHDCPNTEVESLYETFIPRSEEHISAGLRWYYCGGLGLSLMCLSVIAWTHTHRKIPNQRIKKNLRLIFRILTAVVIMCLPLAHLSSLGLVATTTGLIVCVLALELVGSTCWGESFWRNKDCRRNKCDYSARCGVKKEELERSFKEGVVLNVEEIAKRDGGQKESVSAM